MIELRFENAALAIDGNTLLGPIDTRLHLNGITCVLGYNGAGKSLFLELCHGLQEPTSGQVLWDGETALGTRKQRGFIFQNRIILRRSVRDNIALPMRAAGWPTPDIDNRLIALLDMARLTAKANAPAAVLSGGEAQRMSLARALATRPEMVIMDEPTSSLDPGATQKFESLIENVASRGVNFIWATHNIAQARRFADSIVFIDNGTILEHGAAADFFAAPQTKIAQTYIEGH